MIDWVAAALSIAGIVMNAHKNPWCWPVWIASNVVWVSYAAVVGEWAVLATFTAFFAGNVYGWYRWDMDDFAGKLSRSVEVRMNAYSFVTDANDSHGGP
jgi:nicotinamide riboside transporter PnuC